MQNVTEPGNGHTHHDFHDDEIDLFELMEGLWQQKWLIAAVTAACGAIAVVALLLMSPTYQAQTFVRAPLSSELAIIAESELLTLTPTEALQRVEEEINSLSLRREVFDNNINALFDEVPATEDDLDDQFNNSFNPALAVVAPKNGAKSVDSDRRTISFEHSDPVVAAAVVNQLGAAAQASAKSNLLEEFKATLASRLLNLKTELEQRMENQAIVDKDKIAQLEEQDRLAKLRLEDEIAAIKTMATRSRQDEIVRLEEALKVAKSLDIAEPTSLSVLAQNQTSRSGSMAVTTEISERKDPAYLKGTRILSAELVMLKARTSDDQQIPELRTLEMRLALLSNNREVEILRAREDYAAFVFDADLLRGQMGTLEGLLQRDYNQVSLLRIDQVAAVPMNPIKPRKPLILAAALVAGGMLGVLIALIRNAVATRRERLG
ncbi:MAG: Wzz/FepE/Etk N-terminal domain-containing protein [Halioglobus sp.]